MGMRDETKVQREAARAESRRAYLEALCGLSDEELLLELRDHDGMPDFRPEIEAEVRRRKCGGSAKAARA
jgi:hypothetical protein